MESKFTPGTWRVVDRPYWLDVLTNTNERIVSVDKSDPKYSLGDAYLIAAAPDLLKALQEVISVSDRKTDIYDRAKAAINKALNINQ